MPHLPPAEFREMVAVPESAYRTAIAIRSRGRMRSVELVFALQGHDAQVAQYLAICPRCLSDGIAVAVNLLPDGQFAERPACPTLCLACEDSLDSMLEVGTSASVPTDRAGLTKTLKAMTMRPQE